MASNFCFHRNTQQTSAILKQYKKTLVESILVTSTINTPFQVPVLTPISIVYIEENLKKIIKL